MKEFKQGFCWVMGGLLAYMAYSISMALIMQVIYSAAGVLL